VVRLAIGSLAVRAAEGVETSRPRLVDRATAEKYDDQVAIVDYKEFPGRLALHPRPARPEEVADYALDWTTSHVNPTGRPSDGSLHA
jgi:hypothetical protein